MVRKISSFGCHFAVKILFLIFITAHKKTFVKQGWNQAEVCGTFDLYVLWISCRDRVHEKH